MSDHWVYVIYAPESERIKIGRSNSEHGCAERLRSCQTGSPERLHQVATLAPGTHPGEKKIHEHLASSHVHGEWFAAERHTLSDLDDVIGAQRLLWPTFISSPARVTKPTHYIRQDNVHVDRAPFEVEFNGKIGQHTRKGNLYVGYGIEYESISDDFDARTDHAFDPFDKWRDWARAYEGKNRTSPDIPIYWYLCGCGTDSDHPLGHDHFADIGLNNSWSNFFCEPRRTDRKAFHFFDLPIEVKRWHPDFPQGKGGFIEEFTGFRPSYLQAYVTLKQLEAGKQ